MKALKFDSNNCVFLAGATDIVLGIFEGEEKYALYDENEQLICYAMPNGVSVIQYNTLPRDYVDFKYLFINGEFVRNPEWVEPEEPVESRLERIEEAMAELAEIMFGGEL